MNSGVQIILAGFAHMAALSSVAAAEPVANALAEAAADRQSLSTVNGRTRFVSMIATYCDDIDRLHPKYTQAEFEKFSIAMETGGARLDSVLKSPIGAKIRFSHFVSRCHFGVRAFREQRPIVGLTILAYEFGTFDALAIRDAEMVGLNAAGLGLDHLPDITLAIAYAAASQAQSRAKE